MRHRPLATAAAAALILGALAGPAAARGTVAPAQPAVGTATSALNLLSLALAGHAVDVGRVALISDTVAANPVAQVVVTPLKVDGTAYGQQTVTPASSPATVPSVDSTSVVPAALAGLATVKSPSFNASADNANGASSKASASSLGAISVLGIPLRLAGTLDVASVVTGTKSLGEKNVTVTDLALPSVADLLAALGLNLPALPVETLTKLVTDLKLTSTAVATAQAALDQATAAIRTQIDAAQAQVNSAAAALDAKKTELAAAQAQLSAAQANVAAASAAMAPLTAAVSAAQANVAAKNADLTAAASTLSSQLGATSIAAYEAMTPVQKSAIDPTGSIATAYGNYTAAQSAVTAATAVLTTATSDLAAATTVYDAAVAALTALQGTIAALQAAVDALQKALDDALAILRGVLANVQPLIDTLIGAITALLDGTPLVSIDSISVQTQALVTSATAGGQTAKVTGGEIVGLKVLGTDVLQNVLGNTKVDLLDLVGSTLSSVTSTINGLTGTLSSVLSNVPSLPSLSIPAPQIGLLTKSASTDIVGGFGQATNSVKALSITLPAITLPAAVALPNAAALPAISGLPTAGLVNAAAVGDLVSKPVSLSMLTLSEQSKFRPAVTAAPGAAPGGTGAPAAPAPELPTTGLPAGGALLALMLVGSALVLRRRTTSDVVG